MCCERVTNVYTFVRTRSIPGVTNGGKKILGSSATRTLASSAAGAFVEADSGLGTFHAPKKSSSFLILYF
jgi:hypothetical protein